MNNQKLVETLRTWADKLAEMPEVGGAIHVKLGVYDQCGFDEAEAAVLLSGRESVVHLYDQVWAVTEQGNPGGVTIFTTEEKAHQICPPVPLEDVQVPTEVLSGLSGQEVSDG